MLTAIETGYVQKEIQEAAYAFQKEIEKGERVVVGVNAYEVSEEQPTPILIVDPAIEQAQLQSLAQVRASRDSSTVTRSLKNLEEAAMTNTNLMPFIVEAVAVYASVGEISDVLRRVFGEYKEAVVV